MSAITSRAIRVTSTATVATEFTTRNTRPVATAHSAATSACSSWPRNASTIASAIWSQILSGCPWVTDSDEKIVCLATTASLHGVLGADGLERLSQHQRDHGSRPDDGQIPEAQRGGSEQCAE